MGAVSPLGSPPLTTRVRVLVSSDGAAVGRTLELSPGDSVVIGRDPSSSVSVVDPAVSREHLRLECAEGGSVLLSDLGSANGTRVGRWRAGVQPHEITGDSVVRIGRTVLLVGRVLTVRGHSESERDPWVLWCARSLAASHRHGALARVSPTELAEELRQRTSAAGPVHVVGEGQPVSADVFRRPESTLVWRMSEPVRAEAAALVSAADATGGQVIFIVDDVTVALERLVGADSTLEVPRLRRRPDDVWRRTELAFRLAGHGGEFVPTALVRWLIADHDEDNFAERLSRLAKGLTAGSGPIRSGQVRAAMGAEGAPEEARRQMWRPGRGELDEAFLQHGSVSAVARHFGRTRKQVYRWMEVLGV